MQISASKSCPFCGDGHKSKPFCTYADGYHCYSCGAHKRSSRAFNVPTSNFIKSKVELPTISQSISGELAKWLAEYDVDDATCREYKIMQAEDGSAILPVLVDGEIEMYQRRWMSPRRILTYGAKIPFYSNSGASDTIVIVEDFISCVKVGNVTQAMACLGTSIGYSTLVDIVKKYDNVVVWLDGDKPGQDGAKELIARISNIQNKEKSRRAFSVRDFRISNVVTDADPKCYTNTEINNILQKNNCLTK